MGKMNHVINNYFHDSQRFADLFNGICFHGRKVIKPSQLKDVSTVYYANPNLSARRNLELDRNCQGNYSPKNKHNYKIRRNSKKNSPARKEYYRDIRMQLDTGVTLRLLALENQNSVDYTMPLRCMQYDTLEYNQQLEDLRRKNVEANDFTTPGERLCKLKKTDRLHPIYTICMYHGEEAWDGPRSLREMMDFGEDEDEMSLLFKDYPLFLFCLNEETDFSHFHGDVRTLFSLLQYRKNKQGLLQQLEENPEIYGHLNEETLEVASVLMETESIWENRNKYLNQQKDQEGYDMCQAIRELKADAYAEGKEQTTLLIIRNMLHEGVSEENIRKFTLCNQETIEQARLLADTVENV